RLRALIIARRRRKSSRVEKLACFLQERARGERLLQQAGGARKCVEVQLSIDVTGCEDHRCLWIRANDATRQLATVDARQHDVGQQEMNLRALVLEQAHRRFGIGRLEDLVSVPAERLGRKVAYGVLVFDNE